MFQNLGQLINHSSEKFGGDISLETKRRLRVDRFSFTQIDQLSKKFSTFLKSSGLLKGDRILIWAPNSVEWVICFFGAVRIGCVVVPVDFRTTTETIHKFIEQTEPKKIFVSKVTSISSNSINGDVIFLEGLLTKLNNLKPTTNNNVDPEDLAEIVFTSGSTGFPKGVKLTHGNLIASVDSLGKSFPVSRDLKLLSILPLSHIFEQVAGLLLPYMVGAKVVYLTRINSVTIMKGLKRHKITCLLVVPQILHLMLLSIERHLEKEIKLSLFRNLQKISAYLPFGLRKILFLKIHMEFGGKLKFFACGGAPLETGVGKVWEAMGFKIYEGYGSTETAALSTMNLLGGRKIGYAGKPLAGVDIKISDDGEVLVKGPSVFKGYWRNKQKTVEAFKDDWYKTGDIGRIDEDGFLYLFGREKFRIVLPDGRKVYPEDIEKKLNDHPKIKDSCILGLRSEDITYIHAVVLTDSPEDIRETISDVNKDLESSQQITHFSIWEGSDFPRLRTLKVDRGAVEKVITSDTNNLLKKEEEEKERIKLDEITKLIAQLAEVFPTKLSDETNLAIDLKFDSLKRIELISALEEELGIAVDESMINSETTVGQVKKFSKQERVANERIRSTWPRKSIIVLLRMFLQDAVIFPLHAIFAPIKCSGKENLEKISEPAVFFINHLGPHDMVIPLRLLPREKRRRIAIAADAKGWNRLGEGFFLELLADAYPFVKEGSGIRESLEFTGELLDSGFNLLIAPEGKFSPDGSLQPFRDGTGLLGVEFGADMIPIKIGSSYREIFPNLNGKIGELIPRRRRLINVKIGKPLRFSESVDYNLATKKMEEVMRKL